MAPHSTKAARPIPGALLAGKILTAGIHDTPLLQLREAIDAYTAEPDGATSRYVPRNTFASRFWGGIVDSLAWWGAIRPSYDDDEIDMANAAKALLDARAQVRLAEGEVADSNAPSADVYYQNAIALLQSACAPRPLHHVFNMAIALLSERRGDLLTRCGLSSNTAAACFADARRHYVLCHLDTATARATVKAAGAFASADQSQFERAAEFYLQGSMWREASESYRAAIERIMRGEGITALSSEKLAQVQRLAEHLAGTLMRTGQLEDAAIAFENHAMHRKAADAWLTVSVSERIRGDNDKFTFALRNRGDALMRQSTDQDGLQAVEDALFAYYEAFARDEQSGMTDFVAADLMRLAGALEKLHLHEAAVAAANNAADLYETASERDRALAARRQADRNRSIAARLLQEAPTHAAAAGVYRAAQMFDDDVEARLRQVKALLAAGHYEEAEEILLPLGRPESPAAARRQNEIHHLGRTASWLLTMRAGEACFRQGRSHEAGGKLARAYTSYASAFTVFNQIDIDNRFHSRAVDAREAGALILVRLDDWSDGHKGKILSEVSVMRHVLCDRKRAAELALEAAAWFEKADDHREAIRQADYAERTFRELTLPTETQRAAEVVTRNLEKGRISRSGGSGGGALTTGPVGGGPVTRSIVSPWIGSMTLLGAPPTLPALSPLSLPIFP